MSVCQDIWDGKRHELLSISFMFILLEMTIFQSIGRFGSHKGKKAADIAHNTLNVLTMYSIIQQELFRPINDTTASGLLVRCLVVGCKDPGTCWITSAN